VPKSELSGNNNHRGKGGYWTIDPTHMEKFKNGAFAKGASTLMRKSRANHTSSSPPSSIPDTPVSTLNTKETSISSLSSSPSSTDNHTLSTAVDEPCAVMQIHNLLN
jgi:hypothetical protein